MSADVYGAVRSRAIGPWTRVVGHDTDRFALWACECGNAVCTFRGTSGLSDLLSDSGFLLGEGVTLTPAFVFARASLERAGRSHRIVSCTGHSLGGWLASRFARDLGIDAVLFNPAATSSDRGRPGTARVQCVVGDPLALLLPVAALGPVAWWPWTSGTPHSMANFLHSSSS
jgi:hypothetical protein